MKSRIYYLLLIITQLNFSTYAQSSDELIRQKDSLNVLVEETEHRLSILMSELDEVNQKLAQIELDSILESAPSAKTSKSLEGKMRNGVTPQNKVIHTIPKNSEIQLLGYSNGYFKIIYNNKTGYLSELYVNSTEDVDKFKEVHMDSNFEYKTVNQPKSKSGSGRTYIRGPRGGCYYINNSGKKVYVDRSLCN